LNPYLGKDSIDPFLNYKQKGVFLLCKTSNKGSGDLQDVTLASGDPMYIHVAKLAETWNEKNNIGLVVGATHLEAMKNVRAAASNLWFLAPGVGAQGGELEATLKAGLRKDGKGVLLPISRAISRADNPGKAAAEIRDEILHVKRELANKK
jgi:uridine monophosphate synthetase